MDELEIYSVVISRIQDSDGTGSKIRPAVVVKFNDEAIQTYRITSKFESKSEIIKSQYLEIIDWYQAGLHNPSYIDMIQIYSFSLSFITVLARLAVLQYCLRLAALY
ncbi:hypothetical protein [Streptococcus sp. 121]|uniref:hypothetical protein n=1 Tax=Streptococcus sp. 121 TaxID=2797637 RepID=UPI002D80FB57|nr:hypothetical protein [Streptococcus sp. 121]